VCGISIRNIVTYVLRIPEETYLRHQNNEKFDVHLEFRHEVAGRLEIEGMVEIIPKSCQSTPIAGAISPGAPDANGVSTSTHASRKISRNGLA